MRSYDALLSTHRQRQTTIGNRTPMEEFASDRSRIVFSSSFRRLQQKAQVFSLESNSTIRTRLIHSIEVSDIGRSLAARIASRLFNEGKLKMENVWNVVAVVENACLVHDIGNPPFGHFGEMAIRSWARERLPRIWEDDAELSRLLEPLFADFREFDGNPQGFRTITRLHTGHDEYSLNLTDATLLCSLKYARAASEPSGEGVMKKAGWFISEDDVVRSLYDSLPIERGRRCPFTYIMEAADDIAYSLSDIADGIEKHVIAARDFTSEFCATWRDKYGSELDPPLMDVMHNVDRLSDLYKNVILQWSGMAQKEAVESFFDFEDAIWDGSAESIMSEDRPMGRVFSVVKDVSRKILYQSIEAESIELTGYAVITGMLRHYERLLRMSRGDFAELSLPDHKGHDVERRLLHRLGYRFIGSYGHAIRALNDQSLTDAELRAREIWLRVHLIVDNISGMTDDYALRTFQMLEGIDLLPR